MFTTSCETCLWAKGDWNCHQGKNTLAGPPLTHEFELDLVLKIFVVDFFYKRKGGWGEGEEGNGGGWGGGLGDLITSSAPSCPSLSPPPPPKKKKTHGKR